MGLDHAYCIDYMHYMRIVMDSDCLIKKDKQITVGEARDRLSGLSPMISDDERTVVRIKLDALAEKR